MFHIIMLTVENLQVCMLLLGCEKYSLGLLTFKSLKSITYLLTPWSRVLLEKLTGFQLVNKFPAFYGTRRFITASTSARHLSLSWTRSIPSIPSNTNSWRSILILSSHLGLGLPNSLFPPRSPIKSLYTPLLSPIPATCPAHLILLPSITRKMLGEQYRSLRSTLCITFIQVKILQYFINEAAQQGYCRHYSD